MHNIVLPWGDLPIGYWVYGVLCRVVYRYSTPDNIKLTTRN